MEREIKIVELESTNERRKLRDKNIVILEGEVDYSCQEIMEDFELLTTEGKKIIRLIISSEGGDMFDGLAIMRAIKKAQSNGIKVIGDVYGKAQSMAFLILQCCDERAMGKYCSCMCHGVTTAMMGDIKDVDAQQKLLQKYQMDFARLIADRSTAPAKSEYKEIGYWHAILGDNTPQFYSAGECMAMGLIDKIE